MPEYLAPGVYVEEVSFRSKSIEGVSTTTTGFIGPAAYGPVSTTLEPEVVTSLEDFERIYGSGVQLEFTDENGNDPILMHNYLWHAVRAFFAEGGKRLYVARVFLPTTGSDGCAFHHFLGSSPSHPIMTVKARFPGTAGKVRVRFTLRLGKNVLGRQRIPGSTPPEYRPSIGALQDHDIVWLERPAAGSPPEPSPASPPELLAGSPPASPPEVPTASPPGAHLSPPEHVGDFYIATRVPPDPAAKVFNWAFNNGGPEISSDTLDVSSGDSIRVVSLTISVIPSHEGALIRTWEAALDYRHEYGGALDSLFEIFSSHPASPSQALSIPIVIEHDDDVEIDGLEVLQSLLSSDPDLETNLLSPPDKPTSDLDRSVDVVLDHGDDGQRPSATEYEGRVDPFTDEKTGLKILEDVDDISIVAAPGSTDVTSESYKDDAQAIINLLIIHASQMRYRIAVLDSFNNQSISEVLGLRAQLNSKYGALYYPWVRVLDPITRRQINLPPSGFVAGIYARNDNLRAVYKAPANEVVNLALGFEKSINKGQQEVLNPKAVNCFRFFEGRGYLLWGARMATDDPEWKYVNLRRYFAYLEHSIDRGTQWAVFEPNGPDLWANITRTIQDFLFNEWSNGALLGDKPNKAYFVRCDRSTMTQNDLDNGRMVCLIGVAPLRPAEFVIFRIGQWTGDAQR